VSAWRLGLWSVFSGLGLNFWALLGSSERIALYTLRSRSDTALERCRLSSGACRGKRYGTTAVCALRIGNTVYVVHAGDSKAVGGPAVVPMPACFAAFRNALFRTNGGIAHCVASACQWPALHLSPLLPRCPPPPPAPAGAVPQRACHLLDPGPQARQRARGAAAHRGPWWVGLAGWPACWLGCCRAAACLQLNSTARQPPCMAVPARKLLFPCQLRCAVLFVLWSTQAAGSRAQTLC
jgi:hypothetical protein